jgi:hypothetical protein
MASLVPATMLHRTEDIITSTADVPSLRQDPPHRRQRQDFTVHVHLDKPGYRASFGRWPGAGARRTAEDGRGPPSIMTVVAIFFAIFWLALFPSILAPAIATHQL